jgi:tRNA nucleotidyltransferase (CCA-adding enzyme)
VTTLRGEQGYTDGRRPSQVYFISNIAEDLARRDFTINAIAYDPINDVLIDPFEGIRDLETGCLRAVGDPFQRFSEDGLRVLRAARFAAALNVDIEPTTLAAIRPTLESYRKVSSERIRDEWVKALRAPKASLAFRIMQENGLLEITAPELLPMCGCAQNRHHCHDVWEHTLRTLDRVAPGSLTLRLTALLHDVGKPAVRAVNSTTGDYTFHGHEMKGALLSDALLRRLKFPNDLRATVTTLIRHHIVVYNDNWSDTAVRRWLYRVGPELASELLELARADVAAKGTDAGSQLTSLDTLEQHVRRVLEAKQAFTFKDLAVNGKHLIQDLGLAPGPTVGHLLRALLEDVLEAPEHNDRERLLDRARELLKSMAHGDVPESPRGPDQRE